MSTVERLIPQAGARDGVLDSGARAIAPEGAPPHAVRLPGGRWNLWRSVALRGAGFPADLVSRLTADGEAEAADRYAAALDEVSRCQAAALAALQDASADLAARRTLRALRRRIRRGAVPAGRDGERQSALEEAIARRDAAYVDLVRVCEAAGALVEARLADLLRDARFQESILWQKTETLAVVLRRVRDRLGSAAERRHAAEFVAMQVQRCAVKNDSIGFFGPVGWAWLDDDAAIVEARPGPELTSRREVYFEGWCIDALVERLNQDPDLRPWMAPRPKTGMWRGPDGWYAPLEGQVPVEAAELRVLLACDGRRTAKEIAATMIAGPNPVAASEREVFEILERLVSRQLVTWRLEVAPQLHPERELERRLQAIGDPVLRARCLAPFDALCAARARVMSAAGQPERLEARLWDLHAAFTQQTGQSPTRRHGETYAGRRLVYEDCRRSGELRIGPELLHHVGPALSIVLDACRWLAAEFATAARRHLRGLHAEMCGASGAPIDGHRFLTQVRERGERALDIVAVDVMRRYHAAWLSILRLNRGDRRRRYTTAEIAGPARDVFRTSGDTWSRARFVSPDLMIAAAGIDALRRGEFEAVLGEVHGMHTLLCSALLAQHPDRPAMEAALAHDTRQDTVVVVPVEREFWLARNETLVLPTFWQYESTDALPSVPGGRPMPAGMFVAVDDGRAVVMRARDGTLEFDALELFGGHLCDQLHSLIAQRLPRAPHTPRITIDGLTIMRETWDVTPADMGFCEMKDVYARFATVRRWARERGMPRQVFYKSPAERKPCYLDVDSRAYVDAFVKLMKRVRKGAHVRIAEMWPDIAHAWLPDAAGERYTCELRIAARYGGGDVEAGGR